MPDQDRVRQLLEELLDRGRTPEEVCAGAPELLPEVRARWARVRHVASQLDKLFPHTGSSELPGGTREPSGEYALPPVHGYEVQAVLGRGGMGLVFKARQLKPNRPVALKMLLAGGYASPQELARFLREVEAVATLRHPGIVQIYEVGDHAGRPYFTMELVEGGSLAQHLARELPSPRRAAELVATLAVTVQFAHKSGVIHRDLKPANVLLTAPLAAGPPHEGVPKIADFGLARFVDAGPELTLSGARLGTPGYMAPEQALGKAADVGPAVDIYSLGAILYETLTGRPPFDGSTAGETERRILTEDPTPPSRVNARVPRDLGTICLKCLRKNPARRYASAQDLADDLHRFLDGKPVLARPVGAVERVVMWARRHPTAALLVAAFLALTGAVVGTGLWFQQRQDDLLAAKALQQGRAHDAVETALRRVDELRHQERWGDAKLILAEAATQLPAAESPFLEAWFRKAESDVHFASELDRVRESLFYLPRGGVDYRRRATEYQKLFDLAGLRVGDEPGATAASVRASAIRPQVVAALENWAYDAHKLNDDVLAARLLQLARDADPEPLWRDRFRDPKAWKNRGLLEDLADTAFTASPPPPEQQLALLGLLLREHSGGYRNTQLLAQACRRHPNNFWLNREMGDAYFTSGRRHEAAGFYRAALALRPENAGVYFKLGVALFESGQIEEALAAYRRAVALSPTNPFRAQLVRSLALTGYWKEARAECREAMEADPTNSLAPSDLAGLLNWHGRTDEGLALFRKVAEAGANDASTQLSFGELLVQLDRHSEAVTHFRRAMELDPKRQVAVRPRLAAALAAAGRPEEAIAEYRTALAHSPNAFRFSEKVATLLRAQGRSEEALMVLRKAAEDGPKAGPFWDALATAALDQGSFAEARSATERALGSEARRGKRFELCTLLLSIEKQLPAILADKEPVTDAATARALAEWCWKHKRLTATAARLYATAIAIDPSQASDAEVNLRFSAACTAALAGSGAGDDAAALSDRQRADLRKQAFGWLTAEYGAWAEWLGKGEPGNKTTAARAMRSWYQSQDLAAVRDEKALAKLPPNERREWQSLWAKVAELVERDPAARIAQARTHVERGEWKEAAGCYSAAFELEPTDDGNLWFEYAACQLLGGDLDGYRRSCAHMLARCQATASMRAYLVARACTLAPGSTADPTAPGRLSMAELSSYGAEHWSLTELGAVLLREKKVKAATPRLEESLLADDRPGRAVLSWLWLALAYHQLNRNDEAQRWLGKATDWLDQQEGHMPRESAEMGSHRHNWLEAQVLRREAEKLILPPHQKGAAPNR